MKSITEKDIGLLQRYSPDTERVLGDMDEKEDGEYVLYSALVQLLK